MMSRARVSVITVLVFSIGVLFAAPAIDQEQIVVDTSVGGLAIGGGSDEKLAQTFVTATTGCLTHVTVPIGCDPSATLVVEIQDVNALGEPSGVVLASETLPGSLFPGTSPSSVQGGFRIIEFTRAAFLVTGKQYAIVLKGDPIGCGIFQGPLGDPYLAGHAYFDARPNPPGWLRMLPPDRDDLPFQTFVEAGTRDKCRKCK